MTKELSERYAVIFDFGKGFFSFCGIGGKTREEALANARRGLPPRTLERAIGTAPWGNAIVDNLRRAERQGIETLQGFEALPWEGKHRLYGSRPEVVVLDDVQRADPSALHDLAHKPQSLPPRTPFEHFRDLKGWKMTVGREDGSEDSYEL